MTRQDQATVDRHTALRAKLERLIESIIPLVESKRDGHVWSKINLAITTKDGLLDIVEFGDVVTLK